jgi:UDP-N-acetyl-2-amino-2-deoxyglucuronate dehydrogenase
VSQRSREPHRNVLRLALVGCGAISEWHRKAIARIPEIEITAVIDVDEARARAAASGNNAEIFTSLEAALANGSFEAADVMLPHHLHESAALRVIGAGKHLLLEKPLAPDVAACERILAASRSSDKVFMVGETAQYWAEILAARDLIRQGAIGALSSARVIVQFPPSPEFYGEDSWRMRSSSAGGGIALDTGPHFVRALRLLCGNFVQTFAVFGRPYSRMEGESQVRSLLRTADGMVASMDLLVTEGAIAPYEGFRVTGTTGEIVIDTRGVFLYAAGCPEGKLVCAAQPEQYFASFYGELADFANAILKGSPLAASAELARDEVATAAAMVRSARSGLWEQI